VKDRITFVAIEREHASKAHEGIKYGQIKGRKFGVFFL
jgi:hypothetical protein